MGSGEENTHPGPSRALPPLQPLAGGLTDGALVSSSVSGVDGDSGCAVLACRLNEDRL